MSLSDWTLAAFGVPPAIGMMAIYMRDRRRRRRTVPEGVGDIVWIGDKAFVIHTMSVHGPEIEVLLLDRASFKRRHQQ